MRLRHDAVITFGNTRAMTTELLLSCNEKENGFSSSSPNKRLVLTGRGCITSNNLEDRREVKRRSENKLLYFVNMIRTMRKITDINCEQLGVSEGYNRQRLREQKRRI